jgi:uncharacterized protein (TIGR02646 family)
MRPVNKGTHPKKSHRQGLKKFNDPSNAKNDLVERLGPYCSYCEQQYSKSALDVEHVLPKEEGMYPEMVSAWENFLLSCNVCNSRKNSYVQSCPEYQNPDTGRRLIHHFELDDFLWPHLDNTFEAFDYFEDGRVELKGLDEQTVERAANTLRMLKLGNEENVTANGDDILLVPPPSESRAWRCYIWRTAQEAVEALIEYNDERAFKNALKSALALGGWSIWIKVFSQDPDENRRRRFYQAMLDRFPGTATECFDSHAVSSARRPNNTSLT